MGSIIVPTSWGEVTEIQYVLASSVIWLLLLAFLLYGKTTARSLGAVNPWGLSLTFEGSLP